jgi:hypothetical protein
MGKKIILTEGQIKRISLLINEDFDSHIYDLILDKYNEVGLDGMDSDEIDYLKSGGETEIPSSFKEPEMKYDLGFDDDEEEDVDGLIRTLDEIIDMVGRNNVRPEKLADNMYVLVMPYNEDYFQLLLDTFGNDDTEISEGFTKVVGSRKSGKMGIRIPTSWYDKLFGEDADV